VPSTNVAIPSKSLVVKLKHELKVGATKKGTKLTATQIAYKQKQLKAYKDKLNGVAKTVEETNKTVQNLDKTLDARMREAVHDVMSGTWQPRNPEATSAMGRVALHRTQVRHINNLIGLDRQKATLDSFVTKMNALDPSKVELWQQKVEGWYTEKAQELGVEAEVEAEARAAGPKRQKTLATSSSSSSKRTLAEAPKAPQAKKAKKTNVSRACLEDAVAAAVKEEESAEAESDLSSVHSDDSPRYASEKSKKRAKDAAAPAEDVVAKKFKCSQCNFSANTVRGLKTHQTRQRHHGSEPVESMCEEDEEAEEKEAEKKEAEKEDEEAEEKEAENEAEEYKTAAAPEAETLGEKCSRLEQIMYDAIDAKNSVSKRSKKYPALLKEFERARDAYDKAFHERLDCEAKQEAADWALEVAAREEKQKAEQAAREAEQAAAAAARQARKERLKHPDAGPLLAKVKELKNLHNAAHTKMCEAFHAFKVSAECMTKDPALLNGPLRRAYNEAGEEEQQLESLLQKANDELEAFVEGR
jgi:hypothetical protein